MTASSDVANRLLAVIGELPPGAPLGTAVELARQYDVDEDRMVALLRDLYDLRYIQRRTGGEFFTGPRSTGVINSDARSRGVAAVRRTRKA